MAKQLKLTYNEAVAELEQIQEELESTQEVNMDHITVKVKRASELIAFCKKQLHEIDKELEEVMSKLD